MAASNRLAPLTEEDLWDRLGMLQEMLTVAEARKFDRAADHLLRYIESTLSQLDEMRAASES